MGVMELINHEGKSSLIMGDMNIDLLKYNSHQVTNDYIDGIYSHGFLPRIIRPTRVSASSATLIDHILSNDTLSDSVSGIIMTDVADHFGVFHIIADKLRYSKSPTKLIRCFSEDNIMLFRNRLELTDFSSVTRLNCTNDAYNLFIRLYTDAYESSFPLKKITINRKSIKREPWMTVGLLNSSKTKSKLYIKKLKQPTD